MILGDLLKRTEKLLIDNSSTVLTGVAVAGTVTTALLTGKATYKAAELVDIENGRDGIHDLYMPFKQKVQLTWKLYIPAAGTGIATIACIIGANRIGTRRAAAMAAAYSISEKAFVEYKEKVIEKIGANKEQGVRDDIAQDRVKANPVSKTEVIITGGGDVLCYDMYTGRYFQSSMESLKKAQNDLNYKILNSYYASLTDFYNLIGLSRTTTSDDVGWNSDEMLELRFSTIMSDDQRPCIAIDFKVAPIRGYFRVQ